MKEVIILGLGQTRGECPLDTDKEVWGVNDIYDFHSGRLDKVFIFDKINPVELNYDKLAKLPCIVTPIPYPDHPEWNIEIYPIQEVLTRFKSKFFASSICYMVAYALLKGYERIYFYGIDHMIDSAYIIEKGAVEYWMGVANGMGVEVINTNNSATGKTIDGRMYGYWGDGDDGSAELPEELSMLTRELIPNLPGLIDESECYEEQPKGSGNWVRRRQRIRVTQDELERRKVALRR